MIVVCPISAQTVSNKTVVGQSYLSTEFIINNRVDSVILRLVHTADLARIMDYEYRSGAKWLMKIGDAASIVPIRDRFGERDSGIVVLSLFRPPSELWFTFEPQRGQYICQDRWTCSSLGSQTKIVFMERFIDSEGAASAVQTGQRQRMIQDRLVKLKAMCERK